MKQLIVSSFALFWPIERAVAQNVVITSSKMNIVYEGLPNGLEVMAKDCPCEKLVLTTDNGRIGADQCGVFNLTPETLGIATIKTYCIHKRKDSVLAGTVVFRVKPIPPPTAEVGGKHSGKINAVVLRVQLGVTAHVYGLDIDSRYIVTSFNFRLLHANGVWESAHSTSQIFTQEIVAMLKNVVPGDRVYINDIEAMGPDKVPRHLEPIELEAI